MFPGPSFIVSTMQEETTPIFKRLWYDWTQQQPGIEPTNPLGQCWVPPIVAFYAQQGLLRTYSLPGGSIRSPHPGRSCFSQVVSRRRGSDPIYEMIICLFLGLVQRLANSSMSSFQTAQGHVFAQVVLRRRGCDRIYEIRCLFVAVGLNACFIVLPHWDNMS